MSLLVCVGAVLEKKLNFDLLTPSPGSGEVGEGKVNYFSIMLGHPVLYWAGLVKQ